LPEFFIKLLTDENDLVLDIFGGSNTTGYAAESLNRHWLSFELSQEYVATSTFRFVENEEQAQQSFKSIMAGEFLNIVPTQTQL
jgi:site-specific DNA-methyltransferase (cytosine-N4-specific)